MKCPNCNETLLMTQRNNVEIDYCPNCRGIWLDKGELDKLLEYDERRGGDEPRRHDDDRRDYYDDRHKHPRKKKGFLGDFFDFD
ncbi:zf-TFIIB domain-containing protein [Chitinophaga sp. GCM10012297]|uniref:Zf-TFIIB domain-containing protein n=1 Tax=Chitinophaga chungangae TaxID=2821488 RepID=A0ABS3YJB5_9BACT|nr:zf-TFIIB domain-containing protein [Chitinophaga chungangae]MBO9154787.1 zf-TFIIB domain-containing protein [Chitinophaga chungangae]